MKKLWIFIGISLLLTSCINDKVGVIKKDVFIKALEQAYFEGQKDAINGDIRIKLNSDSIYIWTKSPWDETGASPLFIPTLIDTKN